MTPTPEQEAAARGIALVDYFLRIVIALGGAWTAVTMIYRPLVEWRRKSQARAIREILAPDLAQLKAVVDHEDGCASRLELVLLRLEELFSDHDDMVKIVVDNRERLNENNDLLNAIGLTSNRDRREDPEHTEKIDGLIDALDERRRRRRRKTDPLPPIPPMPDAP